MADEEKNEKQQEEETPEAEEKAAEAEAEAAEAEEEAPADAPAEEDAPAEAEASAAEGEEGEANPDAPGGEAVAADDEDMDWRARRRLERSRQSGEAGPQRSPEDRAKERRERRGVAARRRGSYRRKQRQKRERGQGTPPAERRSVARKTRQGRVVSNKPDKTITVSIDIVRRHSSYEKIVRQSSTLHAHDERNEANEGDLVRVVETRPLSRTKRWRLVEILEKAK
jgi:small subunit ribosomal protein S17